MKNKLLNIALLTGVIASSILFTGCGDEQCGLNKASVDQAADQILTVLTKNIEDGNGSKNLRNTGGLDFLAFQECTIPGNTEACLGIVKEGISFNQGDDSYAATIEWTEVNALPDSMALTVASKNTVCTYPVFVAGKVNPASREGTCIKNSFCKEDESAWF